MKMKPGKDDRAFQIITVLFLIIVMIVTIYPLFLVLVRKWGDELLDA